MARTLSSSYTRVEGISPATMRQNGQSLSASSFHSVGMLRFVWAPMMNDVMGLEEGELYGWVQMEGSGGLGIASCQSLTAAST
jgi:hypothetical protein